jgi:predicted nuclease of predicted toxin-antitoxin system
MQIEKIIDALTLALPQRGSQIVGFSDSDIKELSYDLGVDPKILKFRLQQNFKNPY